MNTRETMTRLNNAINTIDFAYEVIAKRHGLNFNSLMMLSIVEDNIDVTQKQICDTLHLSKSTVHSILTEFLGEEYLLLTKGKNNKEKFITFTKRGTKHFKPLFEETRRFEDKILTSLGEDTCSFLLKTTEELGSIIEQELDEINMKEVTYGNPNKTP